MGFKGLLAGLAALAGMAATQPAEADWREATSSKFVVYSENSEARLVEFSRRLELLDQVLRLMTGTKAEPSPVKLRVYLVKDVETVRSLMPSKSSTVAGFYLTPDAGSIAVAHRSPSDDPHGLDGETTLYHEYTHHFMAQYWQAAYPRWYREGYAEYFSTTEFRKDGEISVGKVAEHRMYELFREQWLSTAQLMDDSLEPLPESRQSQLYAQGWLLTHYLFDNPERLPQLESYMKARVTGVPHAAALREHFGMNDEEFGKELRNYFTKHKVSYLRFKPGKFETPKVEVRPLSPAQSALLFEDLRLEIGLREKSEAATLTTVKSIAGRFPDDDYAHLVLGLAEAQCGDPAAALRILEPLTEKESVKRRALLAVAAVRMNEKSEDRAVRLASIRAARKAALEANKLMPEDPAALLLFYKSQLAEGKGATANAIQGLNRAFENSPQNYQTRMLLAQEALRHGERDGAIAVLTPVAYEPHGGKASQTARKLIEELKAGRTPELKEEQTAPAPGDDSNSKQHP